MNAVATTAIVARMPVISTRSDEKAVTTAAPRASPPTWTPRTDATAARAESTRFPPRSPGSMAFLLASSSGADVSKSRVLSYMKPVVPDEDSGLMDLL